MTRFPKDTPLGMAYVPYQQWGEVYNSGDALENGTLFPDLRFPFERGGAR
ncbi:MAG: spore coat associated protein CotJA [Ruminococcus sp.]|nr:spore coat associated protein CotJA [Ruminococcus sp.]